MRLICGAEIDDWMSDIEKALPLNSANCYFETTPFLLCRSVNPSSVFVPNKMIEFPLSE